MLGWMKLKLESILWAEILITSDMQMKTTLMAKKKKKEELKSFLMEVKEKSEKAFLKFSIQKTKIEDYHGGPMFKTLPSSCRVLVSWLGS